MSNIDFDNLSELPCPVIIQPDNSKCVGDLVKELAYNLAVFERALLNTVAPAGMLEWFTGKVSKIPSGYIIADGACYEPSTYPALFDALGYTYGKRDSDDCFKVPDFRGTTAVGMKLGSTCLNDIADWEGLDGDGNAANGKDTVGAYNKYCEDVDTTDCEHRIKKQLAIPLITTGEICI